jgi:5S rRNA maturation endonuclease (ribonuclease M5)
MFNTLKKELRLVEVLEFMTDTEYKLVGDNTWIPEGDECPSCGHRNCFRVKDEGVNEESFAKCFSENIVWDVVSIVAKLKELTNVDAAKLLAKHYEVKLPNDYSPLQEIMNLAANYYHELLASSGPCAELNGLTPLEYQKQIRGHTDESMNLHQIGWSDGGLIAYLESVGVVKEIIQESGLMGKKGGDFLPAKVFIYPHMVRGRVSHFTFKDTLKQKEFQLPKRYTLNGHAYYNSDSIRHPGPIAVVEGENDCISLPEAGWDSGVICCNGSISASQLEWLGINAKDRDVVTFYDADPAGDGYRAKTEKLKKNFKSLTQVIVTSGVKDIDEYLKKGGDLGFLLESARNKAEEGKDIPVESGEEGDVSPIVVKDGCYHKVVYKDGNESLRLLTNFTIELLNVYKHGPETKREIVLVMRNGRRSTPFFVSSDDKVSLKAFKVLAANAMDASIYGTESDLTAIWEKVFSISSERTVYLVEQVGRVEKIGYIDALTGWLFRDCFITDSGLNYYPDETGVMWVTDMIGVKPISIMISDDQGGDQIGIPSIMSPLDPDERKSMTKEILLALSANIGDLGEALTIMGWCWATIHSKVLFEHMRFFPHLQFWGTHGGGKTYLTKMFLDIFNMGECGYTAVNGLNSGVAFSRKMAYYTSLPMCIDEIRNDQMTSEWYGSFRSWYDRAGRSVGTKEGFGVKVSPVRSTTIFGGEDQFSDPATRSRCIPVRIRKNNRETVKSFKVMEQYRGDINAIGYEWILDFKNIKKSALIEEFTIIEKYLKKSGTESRQARNWAAVAIFANKLAKEFCPEYNYMERLVKVAAVDQEQQVDDNIINQFWGVVEGMQVAERPVITSDHMKRVGNELYIWFAEIFRLVSIDGVKGKGGFSKNALLEAIREEKAFVKEDRVTFGMAESYRRCIVLDILKSSESVQSIAKFLDS